MICCGIREFRGYQGLNRRFAAVADALETINLAALVLGRSDLQGDDLFVIASPQAQLRSTALLEAHRKYIDIHVVLSGTEGMGWAPAASMCLEDKPFDEAQDFICYRDPHASVFAVPAGCLAVFFPKDAHAPLLGSGPAVHKCVFKVRVDEL